MACTACLPFVDLFSLMLIFLPLHPKPDIYSVNLLGYIDSNTFIIMIYWALFISLTITGNKANLLSTVDSSTTSINRMLHFLTIVAIFKNSACQNGIFAIK